jgi:ATP-dependent RNA helicase DDX56/DBP9
MKRKLDRNDVPVEALEQASQPGAPKFEDLKLDARLLRAVTKAKFTKPTQVQADAIPLALAGKDILGTLFRSVGKKSK